MGLAVPSKRSGVKPTFTMTNDTRQEAIPLRRCVIDRVQKALGETDEGVSRNSLREAT